MECSVCFHPANKVDKCQLEPSSGGGVGGGGGAYVGAVVDKTTGVRRESIEKDELMVRVVMVVVVAIEE